MLEQYTLVFQTLTIIFLIFAFSTFATEVLDRTYDISLMMNRRNFPDDFVFGFTSSAGQYEGAAFEDGRGPSIWDKFAHEYPDKIADGSNGDVAIDFYHRYKTDVGILKDIGLDAFRFSISWSRILPYGKISGGVNDQGIKFYNNLIDELLAAGIRPFVTLDHWDIPQALEDEYHSLLSDQFVADFVDYSNICFKEFGDRVKHWITLNEPATFSSGGYADGSLAPGRCSSWLNCSEGNSATEPYLVTHHHLLAHAAVVKLYRDKYQGNQKGEIGITLGCHWMEPLTDKQEDIEAAQRGVDFALGWFMDPLVYGHYPQTMRDLVGDRLPKFSSQESEMLKGSFDFIGINYYTSNYATVGPKSDPDRLSYLTDSQITITYERDGIPIGPAAASSWLRIYPKGLWELLLYVKNKYGDPTIYITENGMDQVNNATIPLEEALDDDMRIDFYYSHLLYLQKAIADGVKVKGFFGWTFMDCYEWSGGYTVRFGINFVDYNDNLKRYPKMSALWFKKFLE
ncbi:beta-glucosidase 13-like [Impatiens glandulifera]|uniref:beta-glucosidase 13-like n=1 Tax=Impatiens glandulifera TaxID=253017 RepID=UPI001FB19AF1|nr:beta-glucosidase 13-like [Impatiens glandulifera]